MFLEIIFKARWTTKHENCKIVFSILMKAIVIYLGLSTEVGESSGKAISSFWGCLLFLMVGWWQPAQTDCRPGLEALGSWLLDFYTLIFFYNQWIEDYWKTHYKKIWKIRNTWAKEEQWLIGTLCLEIRDFCSRREIVENLYDE